MLIPSDRPAYRILSEAGFFGPDDHLYRAGDCIVFDDEPNEDMEPLNEPARTALEKFFDKLDAAARRKAEKAGLEYAGRPKSLDEKITLATADARRVQLINGDGGVPLMGGKKRGRPRIERMEPDPTPETGRTSGKLGLRA
jgi:hypothetical protein